MTRLGLIGGAMAVVLLASTGSALSQDKTKIIATRQALMKKQGREWLVIRNYVRGKADRTAALAAVEALSKSVPTVPRYFPPGTGIGEVSVKTRAKPEIWREHDKFLAADKKVRARVAALDAAIKSGDKAKVAAAFKELDGCNACHDTFRAKAQ